MNVLILNWKDIKHPEVGGAEIILYELAKRLVKDGHEVNWFCRSFPEGKRFESVDQIKIVRMGRNRVIMYLLAPLYYWLLQKKPDVVLDCSNTIFWQTPVWALKSKRIGYLNQMAKEVFFYEFPPFVSHFGYLVERLQYLTYKKIKFICYSNSTRDDLISVGVPKKSIGVFNLGIDHTRYRPGKKASCPLFLAVSRLVKMKRNDLVINAFKSVFTKYNDAKLAVVGNGYERKRLEEVRDTLGLGEAVYFVDKDNLFFSKNVKDQKVKLMQQAWALVFPSIKEGWGMTVTECAACGTLSIVTDVSGLRDSVIGSKTGMIVNTNPSVEELAEAMFRIVEDHKLRSKLSSNAIKWAAKFDWEKSYREFKKLL